MQVLYRMIHDKAEKEYRGVEITKGNYEIWVRHWFSCANELQMAFVKEGLLETAKAISDIIVEQMRFCKGYFK